MPMITKGDYVWHKNARDTDEFGVAIGAKVETIEGKQFKILNDDNDTVWVDVNDKHLKLMHPSSIDTVEDMIQLGDLHEAGILRNLFQRYRNKLIYTYTGSILVAVNPYYILPIYDQLHIKKYQVHTSVPTRAHPESMVHFYFVLSYRTRR